MPMHRSRNSRHVNFVDVTNACKDEWTPTIPYRCKYAEVVIRTSANESDGIVGLFVPNMTALDRNPKTTAGRTLQQGVGLEEVPDGKLCVLPLKIFVKRVVERVAEENH